MQRVAGLPVQRLALKAREDDVSRLRRLGHVLPSPPLLDELDGVAGAVRSTVAPHQLIVRSTTAPPRSAGGEARKAAAPGAAAQEPVPRGRA